jgi:serine protease Do
MAVYRTNWAGVIIVSLLVGLVAGVGGAYWYTQRTAAPPGAPVATGAPAAGGGGPVRAGSVEYEQSQIVQAAAKAAPAVVTITATARAEAIGPFGLPFPGGGAERRSLGSGFFFDFNGKQYILTNTHVIAGAQELDVRTTTGEEFRARKLGASPADLAVIEPISGPAKPPVLPLGDSDRIPVGAWVIAVGSPFGFDNTVTVGVVSRKGYTQIGQDQSRYLIQTDAAINEGNSGGPLIDIAGNVIGVNEMIFSPTQTNLGIGWAIPINEAKELMYFLINRGPWLGLATAPNTPGLARAAGLSTSEGLVIYQVIPDSPAAKAGLQQGDVILQIDALAIKKPEDLQKAVLAHKIGDRITIVVQRGKEQKTLTVEAGRVPEGMF